MLILIFLDAARIVDRSPRHKITANISANVCLYASEQSSVPPVEHNHGAIGSKLVS